MSTANLQESLEGVGFTNPVPFDRKTGQIRFDKLHEHISWLLERDARIFIPCGNTGEYYSLTDDERIEVVQETIRSVAGDGVVIGGAGGSVGQILKLAVEYEKAGADGIMIMDPPHTYIHQEGLLDYYRKIITGTELGVVLYKRSNKLTVDGISKLAEFENVVGLKFAVNDVNKFSKIVNELHNRKITILTGNAERFTPAFAVEGSQGFTTGIGNFVPEISLELMEALRAEDWERANQIRDIVRPYEELREDTGQHNTLLAANNVPAVKYGMELSGLYGGPVRPPLLELSEPDKNRADQIYEEMSSITTKSS